MSLPTPPNLLKNFFAGYPLALWNYLVKLVAAILVIVTSSASNVFVYQQGGINLGNVSNTFAGAYAAAVAVRRSAPTIVVDASLGAPVVLPGTYNPSGFTFTSSGEFTTLTWDDLALIDPLTTSFVIKGTLVFSSLAATAPTWTPSVAVLPFLFMEEATTIINAAGATKPFLAVPNGGDATILAGAECNLIGAVTPLCSSTGTGNLSITFGIGCSLAASTLTGGGAIQVYLPGGTSSVTAGNEISPSQPGATALTWAFGPTVYQQVSIPDAPGGGTIGTAATTVDVAGQLLIHQVTAGQNRTAPPPTFNIPGQQLVVIGASDSVGFTFGDATLLQAIPIDTNQAVLFSWNGVAWIPSVSASSAAKLAFSAQSSLTTAAAQNVPVAATVTSTTDNVGIMASQPGKLSTVWLTFLGNAANVAGQTINVQLLKDGVPVPGATLAAPLATTAGSKKGSVIFASVSYAAGAIFTSQITPSAGLTTAVTDVMVSAS